MSIFVFFLVMAIVFAGLVVRSVRAGHGKILLWLAWLLAGLVAIASADVPHTGTARVLAQLWAYSLILLPVLWVIQAARRGGRRG